MRELRDGRLSEDEALLKYGLRLKSTLRAWVAAQQAAEAEATAEPPQWWFRLLRRARRRRICVRHGGK